MQTKSNIQLIRESLAIRDAFKTSLEIFMNKYFVEDAYFTPSKKNLGAAEENTKGYFVLESEYDNFNNVISNMNLDQTIRIIGDKKFQVGKVFEKISDAQGDTVIDITTGNNIQND